MKDQPKFDMRPIGWLLVAVAAYLMGAALSGSASLLGMTEFPNDRRGEWAPLVIPALTAFSLLLGLIGAWILVRSACRLWHIFVITALLAGITIFWLSWRFGYAAA